MSAHTTYRATLSTTPWSGVLLRGLVVGSTLLGMLSVGWTGTSPGLPLGLAVAVVAAVATARPDSPLGAIVVGAMALHWLVSAGGQPLAYSVVPALSLLGVHAGLAALAVTSPMSSLPARSLVRWGVHTVVVAGGTVAVWAASRAIDGFDWPGYVSLTAVGFATVAATALLLGQRVRIKER